MIKVSKNITFNATDEAEGIKVMQALVDLMNSLNHAELIDLASLIKAKPGIVKKAKSLKHLF